MTEPPPTSAPRAAGVVDGAPFTGSRAHDGASEQLPRDPALRFDARGDVVSRAEGSQRRRASRPNRLVDRVAMVGTVELTVPQPPESIELLASVTLRPAVSGPVSCDGESACKRDSVVLSHRWPSICAAYPRGADASTGGRAARPLCLTLLRVEFAEPCRSPCTLVRSYRTVSPSPVTGRDEHARSIGGLSLLHCFVRSPRPGSRQHPALWSPDFPRHGPCRAAATRPTHHRVPSVRRVSGVSTIRGGAPWPRRVQCDPRAVRRTCRRWPPARCDARCAPTPTPAR